MSDKRRDCKPAPYHKITFSRTLATWVRSKLVGDQDWTGPGAQPERQQRWRAGSRDAIQRRAPPGSNHPNHWGRLLFDDTQFGQKKDFQANAIMLTTKGVKIPTISNLSFHICFLLVWLHALNGSSALVYHLKTERDHTGGCDCDWSTKIQICLYCMRIGTKV